jgi:hypothetical protein
MDEKPIAMPGRVVSSIPECFNFCLAVTDFEDMMVAGMVQSATLQHNNMQFSELNSFTAID